MSVSHAGQPNSLLNGNSNMFIRIVFGTCLGGRFMWWWELTLGWKQSLTLQLKLLNYINNFYTFCIIEFVVVFNMDMYTGLFLIAFHLSCVLCSMYCAHNINVFDSHHLPTTHTPILALLPLNHLQHWFAVSSANWSPILVPRPIRPEITNATKQHPACAPAAPL